MRKTSAIMIMLPNNETSRLKFWQAQGKRFCHNDQSYFYRDAGEGSALLMVHGFPTSSWDWKNVFDPLSETFRIIAPDMLGFGYSDKPKNGDYSTAGHAVFHEALLQELGIRDLHILTYSFGSSVVQQMLANALDGVSQLNIKSVTFLNGGLFPGSNHPNRSQRFLLSPIGPLVTRLLGKPSLEQGLRKIFGPNTQPDPQLIDEYWALLNRDNGRYRIPQLIGYLRDRKIFAKIWRRALVEHNAAKQLIVGMTDSISGPEVAEEYRQTIPDAKIIELDNIGHYPQIEAPEIVIDAVRKIAV